MNEGRRALFLDDPTKYPDPLHVENDVAEQLVEAWEEGYAVGVGIRRSKLTLFGVVVFLIGTAIGHSTASGTTETPRADAGQGPGAEASRAAADPAAGVGVSAPAAGPIGSSPAFEIAALEGGIATWYDDGPGLYAAVPSWHFGDRPYTAHVCRASDSSVCVDVTVRDFCGCPGDRIIDLSPRAFSKLAHLWAGIVEVTVETGGSPTPPATETQP